MAATRPRILAIDDTPANLRVLATALASDFAFQLATSGPAGLALAEAGPPDLILLDVMMPEIDGFETCRRIKANPRLAGIPIVFVTALTDQGTEIEGLRLGAVDYLHKPINVDVARQRILNLLEREALRREVIQHRDHLEQLVALRTAALEQTNRELLATRDALESAGRVKTTFLNNMGHELRTPLNVILGMVDLLNSQLSDPALRDKTGKIEHAGRRLLNILNDILLLSNMDDETDTQVAESFGVHALLGAVEAQYQAEAAYKGLRLQHEVAPGVPWRLLGQEGRLKQVLCQLVSNAVKFSDRGLVTLRVESDDSDPASPRIRFSVCDQGIGLDPARVDELFAAFTQGTSGRARTHGGLGVGLAISKHLVRLMGGELGVISTLGQGSCFWVSLALPAALPRQDDAPAPAPSRPAAVQSVILPDELTADQRALVVQLAAQLENSEVDAAALWRRERAWLSSLLGDQVEPFRIAIDAFAFDEALALLRPLVPCRDLPEQAPAATAAH